MFPSWMPGSLEDGMEDGAEIVEEALPARIEEMNNDIDQWVEDFSCPAECTRNEDIQYSSASPIQHTVFGNRVLSFAVVEGSVEVRCDGGISDPLVGLEDSEGEEWA